ncbi:Anaphase-promoting complex subunit cdc20 [Porphyridium purpureum]|uniref:Anaphase-promoting complex subunit cdc20 n=1 Tax=Porphyridium purpureum TaxID=35688 RepID=A0A5J4YUJ8_PORPP|nr:Anaphase-promoting complex subunit cdc20 [Porphyridium purpureum]|eukprot:POR4930..scf227_4
MFGSQLSEVDEFQSFDGPMENAPLARWERKAKALESSRSLNMNSAVTSGTTSRAKTPNNRTPRKTPQADRFIPNRSNMNMDVSRMQLNFGDKENGSGSLAAMDSGLCAAADSDDNTLGSVDYDMALANSLLGKRPFATSSGSIGAAMNDELDDHESGPERGPELGPDELGSKILSFKSKAPEPKQGYVNSLRVLYSQSAASTMAAPARKRTLRHVPTAPEKILDAPDILDDYYLNLLDWNKQNILAVALGQIVYLWNASSGTIEQLCEVPSDTPDDYISSVSWIQDGNVLAVGTGSCDLQLWDTDRLSMIRSMKSHAARVSSLAWNGPLLSSGSRDATIHNHDVRIAQHVVAELAGAHQQEICGLKWNSQGTQLASGGNDNLLCIWDAGQRTPRHTLNHHTAAVKALAWCPWQPGLLASGGGTADRMLRFWNTQSGACVNSIDTKSQVCSIVWNPHDKELLTSHGFSQNQLTLWKYPSLMRVAELPGHTSRVLHTALSADGQTVVSAAADETLRFWRVFEGQNASKKSKTTAGSGSTHGGVSSQSNRTGLRGLQIR